MAEDDLLVAEGVEGFEDHPVGAPAPAAVSRRANDANKVC
jgi:hypothetical protein